MRAGSAERHGLGSEELRARHPGLVYCSIEAFGPTGPLAGSPGYDPLMQAFAGLVSITGEPDRPGVRVGASVIDIGTGVWAALGIVAALLERAHDRPRPRRQRRPLRHRAVARRLPARGRAAVRRRAGQARHGVPADRALRGVRDGRRRADDRRCERPALPPALRADRPAGARGRPALRLEPRPAGASRRAAAADPRAARDESSSHWLVALDGIPVAPVQDLVQVGAHPQTRAGGMLQDVDGLEAVASPVQIDGERLEHDRPPPRLGEHSAEVLRELGLTRRRDRGAGRRRRSRVGFLISTPQKIVCVGLNYRDHAEEQGTALPDRPLLFAKWPNTLIGDGEPIRIPSISQQVDYEAELGVVIGRRASGVSVDDALDYVEGYVVANDVSGSRPAVRRRPVGARQVARHVPAGRRPRAGRRRPRPAGAADPRRCSTARSCRSRTRRT